MNYESSIIVDDVIEALRNFITPFIGNALIIRGQVNRVPMPPPPCVVLTELYQDRLGWGYINQKDINTAELNGPTNISIQTDFFGAEVGEYCQAVVATITSPYAYERFPENIRPLYCSEAAQIAFETGAGQTTTNWMITIALQYNPIMQVPQETASEAVISNFTPVR
jgi:hypothetical protein